MNLDQLIDINRIDCHVQAGSKKRSLEEVSELICSGQPNLTPPEVFERLLTRERLGSTGIGHGVAIPHGRCQNVPNALGAFIQLEQGVEFDAVDREPVDLVFALLVPEDAAKEHLETLASLASMFRNPDIRDQLRKATSKEDVMTILKKAWIEH